MIELFHRIIVMSYILMATSFYIVYGICQVNALPITYFNVETKMTDEKSYNNRYNIALEDIHTQPQSVHIGEDFKIVVTAINHTPNIVSFLKSNCLGKPLFINFIGNNVQKATKICPQGAALLLNLEPGQKSMLEGPTYKAVAQGSAKAVITINYRVINNDPFNISDSKDFSFSILNESKRTP